MESNIIFSESYLLIACLSKINRRRSCQICWLIHLQCPLQLLLDLKGTTDLPGLVQGNKCWKDSSWYQMLFCRFVFKIKKKDSSDWSEPP